MVRSILSLGVSLIFGFVLLFNSSVLFAQENKTEESTKQSENLSSKAVLVHEALGGTDYTLNLALILAVQGNSKSKKSIPFLYEGEILISYEQETVLRSKINLEAGGSSQQLKGEDADYFYNVDVLISEVRKNNQLEHVFQGKMTRTEKSTSKSLYANFEGQKRLFILPLQTSTQASLQAKSNYPNFLRWFYDPSKPLIEITKKKQTEK